MAVKKIDNKNLSDEETIFIDLFVWGGEEYKGKEKDSYEKAFGVNHNKKNTQIAKKIIAKSNVSEYLFAQQKDFDKTLRSEKYRNLDVLAGIRDEMASSYRRDKKGNAISPAADRTVAIKAIETMNKMIGIDEEVAGEKEKDAGITFNLIVPEISKNEDNINI